MRAAAGLVVCAFACAATGLAFARQQGGGGGMSGSPGGAPPPMIMPGPPPPPVAKGTGAVSGAVFDADTKAPLANAFVYLRTVSGSVPITTTITPVSKRTITDDTGRFVFTNLPAMEFSVQAAKSGYLGAFYGGDPLHAADAAHITLGEGTWFARADIALPPAGVISGTVLDEAGEPVVGVYVRLLAQLLLGGHAHVAAGPATLTDDRGAYRIVGLPPGKYRVSVPSLQTSAFGNFPAGRGTPIAAPGFQSGADEFRVALSPHLPVPPPAAGGRRWTYGTTFVPAPAGPDTLASVDLRPGEQRTMDVVLQPVPAVRISGRVDGPPEAFGGLALRLIPAALQELGNGSEAGTAIVGPDGRFAFFNVPAGAYVIVSRRSMTQFGYQMDFQGTQLPPPLDIGGYGRMSSDLVGGPPGSTVEIGRFGQIPGYSARTTLTAGESDVTNVDLTLRPLLTISGRVVRDDGRPLGNVSVNVMADPADGDPAVGIIQGMPDQNGGSGAFQVTGVLDGEYMLRLNGLATMRSVTWAGRDYTDRPIDLSGGRDATNVIITITDQKTQLTGLVTGVTPGASGAQNATVLVFPAEPDQRVNVGITPRRLKSTTLRSDGRYEFNNLPPGRYDVIAMPSEALGDWRDPAFMNAASARAATVTIDWGPPVQQNLRLETVR